MSPGPWGLYRGLLCCDTADKVCGILDPVDDIMESLFVICDGKKNGIKLTYAELYSGICEQWNYCLRRQKYSTSHTHGLDGAIAVEYRGERASWVHMNQTVGHKII